MPLDHGILKLDIISAFSAAYRDVMLWSVYEILPELYHFIHLWYSNLSQLSFGDLLLSSEEGVQQCDPLGPLLYCLLTDLSSFICSQLGTE